jgi:hypothetical protein
MQQIEQMLKFEKKNGFDHGSKVWQVIFEFWHFSSWSFERVNKIISYPSQTFAAYENGQLVRTGPTNTGEKKIKLRRDYFLRTGKQETTIFIVMSGFKGQDYC